VSLLLDTQVLMWWQFGLGQLRDDVIAAICAADEVYVSAASAWEADIKRKLGKLVFHGAFSDVLAPNDFRELPVTMRHAAATMSLPLYHRDPFDRMLIAQATVEGCTLVTSDRMLAVYGVPLLLASIA
jgi:PIN domain nuclease of toxin-antitoxin system